jgi:hypothetical protein
LAQLVIGLGCSQQVVGTYSQHFLSPKNPQGLHFWKLSQFKVPLLIAFPLHLSPIVHSPAHCSTFGGVTPALRTQQVGET